MINDFIVEYAPNPSLRADTDNEADEADEADNEEDDKHTSDEQDSDEQADDPLGGMAREN